MAGFPLRPSADSLAGAIGNWRHPQGYRRAVAVAVLAALLAGTGALVYLTGGTSYAYLHVAYIPIVFGALFFGVPGAILMAIAAALVMGPWMPMNVAQGIAQPTMSWSVRGVFFIIFALVTGLLVELLNEENKAIRRFAYRDLATGLPNQVALLSDLRERLDGMQGSRLMLSIVELGRFEQLRAIFGPERLDSLVKQAAQRLQRTMRSGEKLYRTAPFQLAIVSHFNATNRLHTFASVLQAPADCDGIPIDLEAHLGAAFAPEHGHTAAELMTAAAAALYNAQTTGSVFVEFNSKLCMQQVRSFALVSELRHALRANDLRLYYQPKIDLQTGRCLGAEALLRWHHKDHGCVPPGEFIAYAEQTTLINELSQWAMEAALRQLALWQEARLGLLIAVNLSARDLENTGLPAEIGALLRQHGVDAGSFQIEITETAIMRDPARAASILSDLKGIGVSLAIDDFGAGQSSLTYLASLPVDEIKIDRALVTEITANPKYDRIVSSSIRLGHELGIIVTAEGVETKAVDERLKSHGCDSAQGFLYGRPMPAEDFEIWLRQNREMVPA